jgi:hypothetical protein
MAVGSGTFDISVGEVLGGRYTVEAPLSRGAMGAVYRARDAEGTEVAVKQLLDQGESARFEIEARLLGRLSHPRVVHVVDHFEDDRGKYLVMELIRGTDLGACLRQSGRGLPVAEAVGHAIEACQALQYVHEQNIVHRDVKPQNLVLADGGLVLVDFGIARELDRGDPGTRAIGTPGFMAPEILVGEGVSPRSDIYGLAATLWTLIAYRPPAYDERTSLAGQVEDVTAGLEQTLRAGLELRPEQRIGSAAAFARALGSPLGVTGGKSLSLSAPGPAHEQALLEAIARTAAGVFEAAASSIALLDKVTGELVYQAAWGAGAEEVVGLRLLSGEGISGSVVEAAEGVAVPSCRDDPHFADRIAKATGYVPYTMLAAPLIRDAHVIGVISILDRRDGGSYGPSDLVRARLFADLAVAGLSGEHG